MSFKAALQDSSAATGKDTQFYTMLGTRGIWHEGWFANTVHAATPAGWSHFDKDRWELYHIEADRSQCHDLAAENPDKLEEMKALWFSEAAKYNGLPLADLNILETMMRFRPYLVGDRKSFTYYPGTAEIGMGAAAEPRGQSLSVLAEVTIDTTGAEGVLFKQGGGHGGHVLFIQDGRLHYVYNFMGEQEQRGVIARCDSTGTAHLRRRLRRTGTVENSHTPLGEVTLYIDGDAVASLLGCEGASGNLRTGRRDHQHRAQHRFGGIEHVQGPVRFHRRHHRCGQRRPLGRAVCGRGKRTGTGVLEGLMKHFGWTLVVLGLMVALASGCVRTDGGVAVRSDQATPATSVRPPSTTKSTEDAGPEAPGVVATTRAPIPPDTVTCSQPVKPAVEAVAQVSDPAAPGSPWPCPTAGPSNRAPVMSASACKALTACSRR